MKDPQKRRRRIGLTLAVKHGLKSAGGNAMPDDRKRRPHDPSERAIARWINEGGAPKGVDRSMHPNRRSAIAKGGDYSLEKEATSSLKLSE